MLILRLIIFPITTKNSNKNLNTIQKVKIELLPKLIENQELMEKHSKQSLAIAKEMSWKRVAEKYEKFYKNIQNNL